MRKVMLADNAAKVRFSAEDVFVDPYMKKPVANTLVYDYDDGSLRYRVSFHRTTDLKRLRFVDVAPGQQGFLARLSGFDGAYLRFTGTVTQERLEGGAVVETARQASAVWELMYFGQAKP